MELTQDKIDLIERIVKFDKRFPNNEDLLEDFVNETCKRSLLVINTVTDDKALESYLKKVVTTSVISVLKDSGRSRRTSAGYVSTRDMIIPISTVDNIDMNVDYTSVSFAQTPDDIIIDKETQKGIYDAILNAHTKNPAKQFLPIFEMRYVEGKKQREIAEELNLSQSEISKRLFDLMEIVKNALG